MNTIRESKTRPRYEVRQIPGLSQWAIWDNQTDGPVKSQPVYSNRTNADSAAAECNRI